MAPPLLSDVWYRVADLRPKLRQHARLYRHRYRNELWYLLQDPASGRVHRFTPTARLIIALMDGKRRVADLWTIANRRLGETAPTQDEMVELLAQLHGADLLQSDASPDVAELFMRAEREEKARNRRSYGNPMTIRIPIWDPDAFLERFRRPIQGIWSKWGALVWLAVVLPALLLVPPHWPELTNNFSDRVLAADNLFILYLLFPVIKALHEMGHASAVKAGGGEIHDLGIILLVLLPVPYVEASAATTFPSKYQRALVGAAGVAVELFLAALAFYVWLAIEPGIVRACLFNTMLVAGISTLIFNGNPLLRYDAYYVLADLIEIPNLSARSIRYWGYLFERYVLGVRDAEMPRGSPAEKAWFVFYGLASTIYRVLVTLVIALFIAGRFFVIGVVLAAWALAAMAIYPLIKAVRHLSESPRLARHRPRAIATVVLLIVGAAVLLTVVPVPFHTRAEGVVWLPEQALVRAGANGFLSDFPAEPGTWVTRSNGLIQSVDPMLKAQLRASEAYVAELEATYAAAAVSNRVQAEVARQKLEQERAHLELLRSQSGDLTARANTDGIFVVPQQGDLPGRYYRKGDLLGYVLGEAHPIVRVVVPQDAIDRVRLDVKNVHVRMVDQLDLTFEGRIVREVPEGEEYLPSLALAAEGGGEVATDPRDAKAPKALQRMFQLDVELAGDVQFHQFGQRVFVRFEHQPVPLAMQWYRTIRLLFLSRFSV